MESSSGRRVDKRRGKRKMRNLNVKVNDDIEARLRKFTSRKGDLSRIVGEALELWLRAHEAVGKKAMRESE